MSSKMMIDSSVLVEYLKGTKISLLPALLENDDLECCINETVISEFLFQYVKINSGKAPKTVHQSGKLPALMQTGNSYTILNLFHFLPTSADLYTLTPSLMSQYNLLPNDAIILATCKIHGITRLATHDSDFAAPCKAEGVTVLTEP